MEHKIISLNLTQIVDDFLSNTFEMRVTELISFCIAAVPHVKYACDSKDLKDTLKQNMITLTEKLTNGALSSPPYNDIIFR